MKVLAKSHQFLTFTTPPNLQSAVAYGLAKSDDYFDTMRRDFARSRDRFTAGLETLGFAVIPSQGTYFLNIDISALGENDDVAFCRRLVTDHGVAAIPVSAFYAEGAVKNRGAVLLCQEGRDPRCGVGAAGGDRTSGSLTERRAQHRSAGRCHPTRNLLASGTRILMECRPR